MNPRLLVSRAQVPRYLEEQGGRRGDWRPENSDGPWYGSSESTCARQRGAWRTGRLRGRLAGHPATLSFPVTNSGVPAQTSALGAALNSWVPAMWDHWEGALWIPPSRNFGRIRDKPCPRASEKCSCQTAGMPAHHSLSFRLSQEVPSGMGMWVLLLGSVLTHYCCRDAEQECVCVCVCVCGGQKQWRGEGGRERSRLSRGLGDRDSNAHTQREGGNLKAAERS